MIIVHAHPLLVVVFVEICIKILIKEYSFNLIFILISFIYLNIKGVMDHIMQVFFFIFINNDLCFKFENNDNIGMNMAEYENILSTDSSINDYLAAS